MSLSLTRGLVIFPFVITILSSFGYNFWPWTNATDVLRPLMNKLINRLLSHIYVIQKRRHSNRPSHTLLSQTNNGCLRHSLTSSVNLGKKFCLCNRPNTQTNSHTKRWKLNKKKMKTSPSTMSKWTGTEKKRFILLLFSVMVFRCIFLIGWSTNSVFRSHQVDGTNNGSSFYYIIQ